MCVFSIIPFTVLGVCVFVSKLAELLRGNGLLDVDEQNPR